MGQVEKLSVSFPAELAADVRTAAQDDCDSVSGWLADAAAARLKLREARAIVDGWQSENRAFTDEELAAADRRWFS